MIPTKKSEFERAIETQCFPLVPVLSQILVTIRKQWFVVKPKYNFKKYLDKRNSYKVNSTIMLNCNKNIKGVKNFKFTQLDSRLVLVKMELIQVLRSKKAKMSIAP